MAIFSLDASRVYTIDPTNPSMITAEITGPLVNPRRSASIVGHWPLLSWAILETRVVAACDKHMREPDAFGEDSPLRGQ